jgi:nucleoside-diphosphate-sugar epimerase
MIIGSGLLAQSFAARYKQHDDFCVYAAGVSNSTCNDEREFERERSRLVAALDVAGGVSAFAYFGTCSVGDIEVRHTAYVQHKLAMERLVEQHPGYVIMRLPQVAGHTPNPHTLLNFLHSRISRSEVFSVWRNAYRNIIDVDDVAVLGGKLLQDEGMRRITLNIANPTSYSMLEIVHAMEQVVGKRALYDVLERGHRYDIDVSRMLQLAVGSEVDLTGDHLNRTLRKYYEYP